MFCPSYIKPQHTKRAQLCSESCMFGFSYIRPQHNRECNCAASSCMSYSSYIKPRPLCLKICLQRSCMSCSSYIKPQLGAKTTENTKVVCLVLPTSNHNLLRRYSFLFYRGKIIKFSEINNVCLNKKRTS